MIRMMGRFVLTLASLALIVTAHAYGGQTTVLIPQPGYVPKVGDRAVLYSLDNEAIPSDLWCATTSQGCRTFLASLFAEEKDEATAGPKETAKGTPEEGIVHLAPKTDVQLLERESVELPGANGGSPLKCAYFAIKVLSGPFQGKTLYTLDFHITRLIEPPASGTTTIGAGDLGDLSLAPSRETAPPLIPLGPETTNAPPPPQATVPNSAAPTATTSLPTLPLETPAGSPKTLHLASEPPTQNPDPASATQTSPPAPASAPPQMITLEVEATDTPAPVAEKPTAKGTQTSAPALPSLANETPEPTPAPAAAPAPAVQVVVSTPATPSETHSTNQVPPEEAPPLAPLPRITLNSVTTPQQRAEAAPPPINDEPASPVKDQDEPAPMIPDVPPPLATAATPSDPIAPLAESKPRPSAIQGADATSPAPSGGVPQSRAGAASTPGSSRPEMVAPGGTAAAAARPQSAETSTPRFATPIFATPAPGPAPEMLAAAKQWDEAGKTFEALAAYRRLVNVHPGTTEARTAALRIPPLDEAIEAQIQEKRAARVLERVRSLETKGERTLALEYLQQIVAVYPKTATARQARERLQEIASQPTSQLRR